MSTTSKYKNAKNTILTELFINVYEFQQQKSSYCI